MAKRQVLAFLLVVFLVLGGALAWFWFSSPWSSSIRKQPDIKWDAIQKVGDKRDVDR